MAVQGEQTNNTIETDETGLEWKGDRLAKDRTVAVPAKGGASSKILRALIAGGLVFIGLIALCAAIGVHETWGIGSALIGAFVIASRIIFSNTSVESPTNTAANLSGENTKQGVTTDELPDSDDIHRGNQCSFGFGLSYFTGDED